MYIRSTILALAATSVLASTPAFADGKSYPGHVCLTHNEDVARVGSKFQNSGTAAATVACPVIRDNLNVGFDAGTVWVVDQHFTENVSCTLAAKAFDGGSVAFTSDSTSGTNPAAQALNLGSLAAVTDGHYTMYCTVPPVFSGQSSSIVSYLMIED
jgi:hypothetical protein